MIIVGDPKSFAIETHMSRVYKNTSLRASGFFLIHVAGNQYGTREVDATYLACSFDEINNRIERRGQHNAPFASKSHAAVIADAFRMAIFGEQDKQKYLGLDATAFKCLFTSLGSNITWAPDGDAAFDDGSYVLQFDVNDEVRLIAFKSGDDGLHNPETLSEIWMSSERFYATLLEWKTKFQIEWKARIDE